MSELGLPDEENASDPQVRAWWVIVGLVGVGVGFAAIWSLLAWGISNLNSDDVSSRSGADCTDLGVSGLEELFVVDLPEQATVLECDFDEAQDWYISATFSTGGADVRLDETWSAEGPDDDGVFRDATTGSDGGTTTLTLTMFTT